MTLLAKTKGGPILLVDDSVEDRESTTRAFKKAHLANEIVECVDGEDALDYLFRRNKYAGSQDSSRPSIILLDLNMPGTDGHEVLAEIKRDKELASIPVIVLTTSSDERDIERCYAAGGNSYVQKPVDLPGFITAIQRLKEYWFEVVLMPPSDD